MNISRDDDGFEPQIEHLLEVVNRNRDERCAKLRDKTRAQAKSLLQQAHADARAHMHQHVVDMREKYRLRVAAARARNETLARLQQQQTGLAMLDHVQQPLREALLRRWANPSSRQLWIHALLNVAKQTLLAHDWRIEHPPDWPHDEREQLRQHLVMSAATAPVFVAYADIDAGLRIVAHSATVDASIDGLLQRKTAIEAMLMARLMPLMASSVTDTDDHA